MDKLEKYILLVALMVSFSTIFVLNSSYLGMPTIAKDFLMDNVTQNWAYTILAIFISAFTIPAGQICSKYGCKKILITGCSIILAGLILAVISNYSWVFLVSRAILGIGYALCLVAQTAIIVVAIDKKNRGRSIGIAFMGPYLGSIISPLLGGYIITHIGWRYIFYLTMPLIIVTMLLIHFKIDKDWVSDAFGKIDFLGSFLYVVGIILFIYGFSVLLTFYGQVAILIGLAILIIFGIYESKIESPVFNINLFRNDTFSKYNMVGFFGFFAVIIFDIIFNYFFQYAKGWDPQLTGMVLLVQSVVLALVSPNAGKLSDKFHPQMISTIGLVILLVAIIGLSFLDVNTPVYVVVIAMILIAVGTGLFSSPNSNAIMSSVDEEYASYASATQSTLRACGETLGLGLLTLVCSFVMGDLPLSVENAGLIVSSSRIVAVCCSILCFIAIAFAIWGIRTEKTNSV